jgi:dipeptidyl aminopeptidase/acylaminoacyl peptidase
MWANNFHYRWNSQLFAAPGYVVVMVNPHGSKGYGQKFCDAVSKDWGGLPYEDLMKGLDVALEKYPFIDGEKIGAAGASYGGFMINWIAGHNNRFTAMVSHDGVYNMSSMYGATEELWFPEWEFGGNYYEHPELYEKWSPHHFAKNFKTPILVVHSEKDYRVPVNQGMELFTALQRMGVPSKWLYFPDEDHFVQKPLNAKMWWQTVHAWFKTYLKN